MWSILFVELLHPIVVELDALGAWEGCRRCPHHYESVRAAALTIFQQIVCGDSWGLVTIQVIEYSPLTMLIYIPCFISVAMCFMNLVLTVIVDRATEAQKANESDKL